MFGLSRTSDKEQKTQTIDPSKILFTVPTLSDDIAPLEQLEGPPSKDALVLHEDDWCQVEFLPRDRLVALQRIFQEYKAFELANRTNHGWRNVYVRKLQRTPLITGADALHRLESLLGIGTGPAPILHSSGTIIGRPVNGFSIELGGTITLYGYTTMDGIPVLAASVGPQPDDRLLTNAFLKLHHDAGLILVDWKQQFVLMGASTSGEIKVWRP